MQIITHPEELRELCYQWWREDVNTGLVPTMGYFHAGHESLIKYARANSEKVITTLFVNPAQFAPHEDLATYPRDLDRDAAIAESHGTDILYAPEADTMYDADHATWVEVPELAKHMCGASRPIFFRGICTVVTKLFMLTMPKMAVFGEKDWQQLAIIKRMVRDLRMPVNVVGCPLIREEDGLAMSSRNVYLSLEERAQAPGVYKGLLAGRAAVEAGETNVDAVKATIRETWAANVPLANEDYMEIIHPESLERLDEITGPAHIAVALLLGKTRLIDNVALNHNGS